MKRIAVLGALYFLAGCNSSGNSGYGQYYQVIRNSLSASFGDGRITKDQAAAVPYASMGYRLNGGNERLVVLATDANGEQLWTSATHAVIVTRGGRITRTVGLENDVVRMTSKNGEWMPEITGALIGSLTYTRVQDFPSLSAYDVTLTCTMIYKGAQTVSILGRGISTARIDESCSSARPAWSFTNTYWIDPDTGFAWRSRQHLVPEGDVIDTEILRPPG